jgi:hypothetical protein
MFNLVVLCNEGDTANLLLFVCIQTTFLQEQSNGGWLSHAYKKYTFLYLLVIVHCIEHAGNNHD